MRIFAETISINYKATRSYLVIDPLSKGIQQRVGPWNQSLWRSSRDTGGGLEIGFAFKNVSLSRLDLVVFTL